FSRDWSSDVCSSDLLPLARKAVTGAQHPGRGHDQEVQQRDAGLVGPVAKEVQAQPLDGVEDGQDQTEEKEEKDAQGIGKRFCHGQTRLVMSTVKIKKPPKGWHDHRFFAVDQQNSL